MVIHKEFSKQKLLLKNAADAILAGESKFVLTIFEKKKKKKNTTKFLSRKCNSLIKNDKLCRSKR